MTTKRDRELKKAILRMVEFFGSQAELAKAAGRSEVAVHYWATGQKRPSLTSLIRIERASKGAFVAEQIRPELF